MTPKSSLRHPEAVSQLAEFSKGAFQEVLGDRFTTRTGHQKITTVIICSGKIYYELPAHRRALDAEQVPLARLDQLYPFPLVA